MKRKALHRPSKAVKERETSAGVVEETMRQRVIVKFHDSVDLPYEDGAEEYVRKRGVGLWDDLAGRPTAYPFADCSLPSV